MLIKAFTLDTTATQAAALAKVSRPCANRWFKHFRELIYASLRHAPRFMGEVEVDSAFFGGRGQKKDFAMVRRLAGLTIKQIKKAGRKAKKKDNKIQVLALLQRSGDIYLHPIARADTTTLLSVIHLVIEPGSTIYTDEWPAFNKLKLEQYKHLSINHSVEYSRKGIHINGVESFFSYAKHRLHKFKGISRTTLPLHLKECEFRYNNKDLAVALKPLLK